MIEYIFKNGNIFDCDAEFFVFYGHFGMAFNSALKWEEEIIDLNRLKVTDPFDLEQPIVLKSEKKLYLYKKDFMDDADYKKSIIQTLMYAKVHKIKSLAINGCRNTSQDITNRIANQNERVEFTIATIKNWLASNNTDLQLIYFCSMGDYFIR
jgi:hypothetical protein